jgi:uncharacterized protein YggT (Ycf19 family)
MSPRGTHSALVTLMHADLLDTQRTPMTRVAVVARIARVVDYLFGILYAVLLIRLALEFFNARSSAGFVELIRAITDPFYAPFKAIVATNTIAGAHLVWPLVVAILGYMALHAAIRGLLRLVARG